MRGERIEMALGMRENRNGIKMALGMRGERIEMALGMRGGKRIEMALGMRGERIEMARKNRNGTWNEGGMKKWHLE